MQKDKSFISVILKLEDFVQSADQHLTNLESYLSEHFEYYEIVLVLNGTSQPIKEQVRDSLKTQNFKNLTIIWLKDRIHSEHAMLAGVHRSIGDFIYQIPFPNFDFEFELLSRMLSHLRDSQVHVVSASPAGRTPLTSKAFYKIFNSLSLGDAALSSERVLLTSRRSINAASKIRQNLKYFKLLLSQAGYSCSKITYKALPNKTTLIQAPTTERMELALDLLLNYSTLGSRLSFIMSGVMILFAFTMGIYSLYSYLHHNVLEGWTSLMGFLSVSFAGVFLMMAILASSVRKLIDLIQNQSTYKIEDIYHFHQD